jgi:hypothetical protein
MPVHVQHSTVGDPFHCVSAMREHLLTVAIFLLSRYCSHNSYASDVYVTLTQHTMLAVLVHITPLEGRVLAFAAKLGEVLVES